MVKSSLRVSKLLEQARRVPVNGSDDQLLAGAVNAAVLSVYPVSAGHLNGTFAFCGSLGLKAKQMNLSIADGCFQTLNSIAGPQAKGDAGNLVKRSIEQLRKNNRIPMITINQGAVKAGKCPFYLSTEVKGNIQDRKNTTLKEPEAFDCPFIGHDAGSIHDACKKDEAHKRENQRNI